MNSLRDGSLSGSALHRVPDSAIRCRFVSTVMGSDTPAMFPSNGVMTLLALPQVLGPQPTDDRESVMLIKVYEFEFLDAWPYAKDVAVRVAADRDPIVLADDDRSRMYRTYLRHPDRYVSWGLIEGFDPYDHAPESFAARAGKSGFKLTTPCSARGNGPMTHGWKAYAANSRPRGLLPFHSRPSCGQSSTTLAPSRMPFIPSASKAMCAASPSTSSMSRN